MIKVIIFDADGMLLSQERPSIFLPKDYGISTEQLNPFFNGPFQDCLIGKADLKEVILPYLTAWNWSEGLESFLKLWFTREVRMNTELSKYISELRAQGIVCILATNQEKYRFQYMLEDLGFAKIFNRTYASSNVGYKKPKSEFFQKIMEDLGNINKEEILFWDDREENVQGAKDFGFNSELYTTFDNFIQTMDKRLV